MHKELSIHSPHTQLLSPLNYSLCSAALATQLIKLPTCCLLQSKSYNTANRRGVVERPVLEIFKPLAPKIS